MNDIKLFFRGFKAGFAEFGHFVADIVNYVLLSFVYFIGVGSTSIAAKLSGKHFLALRKTDAVKSYWVENKISRQDMEDYYRQF